MRFIGSILQNDVVRRHHHNLVISPPGGEQNENKQACSINLLVFTVLRTVFWLQQMEFFRAPDGGLTAVDLQLIVDILGVGAHRVQ